MKGYPRHFNTKKDVEMALELQPDRTKRWLQQALDGREGWHVTGHLDTEADGVTDDTHRVVDQGDEETGPQWYQQEWGPLPGNALDRLGISVSEAEELIG